MKFIEWIKLREVSTSTGDVAAFRFPMGMVTRTYPTLLTVDDLEKHKKHKKHKNKFFDL